MAFQTFLMVKDETVQVMVYRFGAATVQSLPLLGIKLGVPLAVVSWLYSMSFHLHFLGYVILLIGITGVLVHFRRWYGFFFTLIGQLRLPGFNGHRRRTSRPTVFTQR